MAIRLGDLLVKAKVINESQLKAALVEQQKWGGKLGELLVRMNFLTEDMLVKALSKQMSLPSVALETIQSIPPHVKSKIPSDVARDLVVLPLQLRDEGKTLVVAMAEPQNLKHLDTLRSVSRLRILPQLAGRPFEAVSLSLTSLQTGSPFAPSPPPDLPVLGDAAVQIVPSGPQATRIRIDAILLAAVYAARREIVLTTPYFVPGEALLTALRSAALRGVRVILIVPERIDSTLVRLASDSYNGDLLSAGVEIRRFRDGLLHTKSIVIDEEITLFGTVNLDIRSFELNFEVSLIVYDRSFSAEMRALQRDYEARSALLLPEQWRARPRLRRLVENAVQTMSPLL